METEYIPHIYANQDAYIEAITPFNLPVVEFPVLLGISKDIQTLVTLRKVAGNPKKFRSERLRFLSAKQAASYKKKYPKANNVFVVKKGDIALVKVAQPYFLPPTPIFPRRTAEEIANQPAVQQLGGKEGAMALAKIYQTPADLGDTWKEMIAKTAKIHGISYSVATNAAKKVVGNVEVETTILSSNRKVDIKLGDSRCHVDDQGQL